MSSAQRYATTDPITIAQIRHELDAVRTLELPGLLRVLELEQTEDGLCLLQERASGQSLAQLAHAGALSSDALLPIVLALTATVADIHERGFVHNDLRPATLYFDASTGQAQVGPVGLPTLLEQQRRESIIAGELDAVLPYLAPELGNRYRVAVDARSDLYSLGATFYRLLAGRSPFAADSRYNHRRAQLSRVPRPIPGIPRLLFAIVVKLLAKSPRERYQSAAALLGDLRRHAEARASGVDEPEFELGVGDRPTRLRFSGEIHGCQPHLRTLASELASAHESASTRVVVVHGPAGAGKTALLEVFDELVVIRSGLFGIARFEPGGAAHAALFEALESVVEQFESNAPESRDELCGYLRERVGAVLAVLAARAPALARALGELDAVPVLEPAADRRRYELAWLRLLGALGELLPLALAFDQLEAASPDDLALLRKLLGGSPPLLLLFACADEGLEPEHPAAAWLAELARDGVALRRVGVGALRRNEVIEWTAELFGSSVAERASIEVFVESLERHSGRIPGAMRSCVEQWFELGLIEPTHSERSWDVATLERTEVAVDGHARVKAVCERLSERELELLELAAVLGECFSARALARASDCEPDRLVAALDRLVQLGLLALDRHGYRFAWGVRAAISTRMAPDRRRQLQLAVTPALDSDIAVAAAVARAGGRVALSQLEPERREQLAKRCAAAGRTALASGAWNVAHEWLAMAMAGLEPAALDVELSCELALALALAEQREQADAAFEHLLGRPLALASYAQIVACRVRNLTQQGRTREATELGLAALARCGVHLRQSVGDENLGLAICRTYLSCRGLDRDALEALEPVTSEVAAELMITDALADAAYFEDSRSFALLAALRAQCVARGGLHSLAPLALAHFAVAVATVLRQTDEAARLCDLAVELCDVVEGGARMRARVQSVALVVVWPMARPLAAVIAGLGACQNHAIEHGDIGVAGVVATVGLGLSFHAGVPLPELQELGSRWRMQIERWASPGVLATVDAWLEFVAALVQPRREADRRAPSLIADLELANAGVGAPARHALALNGALALWLLGEREAAAARMDALVDDLERQLFGSWQIPPGAVMLAIIANHRARVDPSEARSAAARIRLALRLARRFGQASWANYGAHVELITAEWQRLRGRDDQAVLAYERARELAADGENVCMQALACDRLATLALATGRQVTARGAAVTAVSVLRRWGAEAAARRLEVDYAELLALVVPSARTPTLDPPSTSPREGRHQALDAATVLDVMHVISEELRFEELLARVISSAVSNPSHERAALLLEHEGVIGLVARGDGTSLELLDPPIPLAELGARVPKTVVAHTLATGAMLVIDDSSTDLRFAADPYLQAAELAALACMPITRKTECIGVLLVENRVASGAFPLARIEVLRILLTRAASALSHARLYEALQRSEVLFRSLVDGVPDMISVMNLQGRVEFINHVAGFDFDPKLLVGVDSTLIMDPSCGPQWRAAIEQVAATGEWRELEIHANFPGGLMCWYAIRLGALEFSGKVGKLISIATDITQRKLAEAEKLQLEAQLRQQQRLESVGTLASGVAHEINNPIQGIMNYADLILSRAHDTETVIDFTAEILTESERIATIVRNLLAFSRQEAEQTPEVCDLQNLIDTTLSLIRAVVRKDDIELHIDVPGDLHEIRCRYQQIQQIIMNLVANARDALNERYGEGGPKSIEIRAANLERDGRHWVRMSIQDCGTGIPEHIRARIFDPFFTTKGRDQGTGLGLAVSHGIAVEHGGELWVESEVGVGSTFHLELPAAAELPVR
jgi:signal transduction histidine kinase